MPMDKCTFNPGNECLGLQKANMLEKSLNSHLDAARQTHKEMYDRIRALETESARRDEQYVQILDKLDEMSSKITSALSQVSEIQIKPSRGLGDVYKRQIKGLPEVEKETANKN